MKKKNLIAGLLCGAFLSTAVGAQAAPLLISPQRAPIAVELDGTPLDLGGLVPYERDGHVMLPIRAVGEALGFTVTWIQESQGVKLDDGSLNTTVFLGVDSCSRTSSTALGMGALQSLGTAPEGVDGRVYVPAELFAVLDYTVTVGEDLVSIGRDTGAAVELPNPVKEYATLAEALEVLPFEAQTPKALPGDLAVKGVSVIGGQVLQVIYTGVEQELRFRTGRSDGDISGDYNAYPEESVRTVGERTVRVKGADGLVSLALWSDGTNAYALSFSAPVDAGAVDAVVSGVG